MGKAVDRQAPPTSAAREAAVEVIAAAYGDGQLTLEEHQQRLAGVRDADSAWQLERWTHDLQAPEPTWREGVVASAAAKRSRVEEWLRHTRPAPRRHSRAVTAAAIGLMVVCIGILAWNARDTAGEAAPRGLTTGLHDFREAYADEFDSTEISALQIDPDYVRFEVMVETDPPRSQVWAQQGGSFSEVGGPTSTRLGAVDLADIDVEAVDEALSDAIPELGVADASEVTTIIRPVPDVDQPRVSLVVRNEFDEQARLVLEFDGDEISRDPFEEPGSR